MLCCAIRRLFRPRKLSLFDGKTIDDDYFATIDQRQKKTDSIIFTKKIYLQHSESQVLFDWQSLCIGKKIIVASSDRPSLIG